MRVVEKYNSSSLQGFQWLNFESLPESDGYKAEIFFNDYDGTVASMMSHFYYFFSKYKDDILINQFGNYDWGDYCLDDFSESSNTSVGKYLGMLSENEIEYEYKGFVKCLNWNRFLNITLENVVNCSALYGMIFYVINQQFAFYFHYSGSIGLYYKELNSAIKQIIMKANKERFRVANYNDERIKPLLK